jgi:natural product biosynthesis luciferase-like monooxygenase protein
LAPKIQAYKQSLSKHGHDPDTKIISLMLHTFLGADIDQVKNDVRQPFCEYLKTHYGLLENLAKGMGLAISLEDFSDDDLDSLLLFGVEGFMNDRSLIGTPESCFPFIQTLAQVGITEIACLIDFVQNFDRVMQALPYLKQLKNNCAIPLSETAMVGSPY